MDEISQSSHISLEEQIRDVEREIKLREQSYPRFVTAKKLTQARADRQLETMRAVRETLRRVQRYG